MSTNRPSDPTDETPLRVRRGRVDSVDLYEIKDSELDLLEKGSPSGTQLNFSIFLLSIAFTSIACLFTATFEYGIVKTVFVVVAVVGILMGAYLLISWRRTRTSLSEVVKGIRERMPDEPAVPPEAPETTPKPAGSPADSDEPVG